MQGDVQNLARKIGELEQEADEHEYVGRSQVFSFLITHHIYLVGWF
jgi:hypothetical protein